MQNEKTKKDIFKNYKKTLNLPKTSFSMKANLNMNEPKYIKKWDEIDLYSKIQKKHEKSERYILQDGPPYANGNIHIGHALNKILKDFIIKSKNLNNLNSTYIPGWDCHGLPIELKIEKKLKSKKDEIKKDKFQNLCRKYAQTQIDLQKTSFKRLGILADWKNYYSTMNFEFESSIVESLANIIKNKHITNGYKPVHWCIKCESSLSDAEIEYKNKKSNAIDVLYEIIDNSYLNNILKTDISEKIYFIIWTTTPWTLPSSQAVAINSNIKYVILEVDHKGTKKYTIFSKVLTKNLLEKYEIKNYKIIGSVLGKHLEKIILKHPFYDKEIPVVIGKHVNTDTGTGCVHIAPDHGVDDFSIGKQYKLNILNLVDSKGFYKKHDLTQNFFGANIFENEELIISTLKKNNKLLSIIKFEHSYPHCWRHNYPLIFLTTFQWFISMEKNDLKKKALECVNKIEWKPKWGKERISDMLNNRPDWCISRQRTWNTPLCFVINKKTGCLHPNQVNISYLVSSEIKKSGLEAWSKYKLSDLIDEKDIPFYEKSKDGLDVWFDSGIVHYYFKKFRNQSNNKTIYLEGTDQYRGWFMSSLLTSVAIENEKPFDLVISHGFTGDSEGKKMSKSIGNVIIPEDITKEFGADILRLWVSSVDCYKEQHISYDILNRISDTYRRIRNTCRFLLSNINDFSPKTDIINENHMLEFDIWIIQESFQVQEKIILKYNEYKFNEIYVQIHNFCSNILGSFYLDIVKDRLYTCKKNSLARRSCQTALYYILEMLSRWISPILSFTSEEIWSKMPDRKENSIFLSKWFEKNDYKKRKLKFNSLFWYKIIKIKSHINKIIEKIRKEKNIGSSLDLEVNLYCTDEYFKMIKSLRHEAKFIFIVSILNVYKKQSDSQNSIEFMEGLHAEVNVLNIKKCIRCWQKTNDVGKIKDYPDICLRCISNVYDQGEKRNIL